MTFAIKYRPKSFDDVVGQDNCIKIIKNTIKSKNYHAYLLTGTRGVGKTTIARIIAKSLNCINNLNNNPCNQCDICKSIDVFSCIDVVEIDAASNTGVDNIREIINDAKYLPTSTKYKIYIIDEVHMLSKSAFNAMLKILEEPPEHVFFVLATTELNKVPITILSRCLQIKLSHIQHNIITQQLMKILKQENIRYDDKSIELIANVAQGSIRDALSTLDIVCAYTNNNINYQATSLLLGIPDDDLIIEILTSILQKDANTIITITKQLHNTYPYDIVLNMLLKYIVAINTYQLIDVENKDLKSNSTYNAIFNKLNLNAIHDYASVISNANIQLYFEIINLGIKQLSYTQDHQSIFMMIMFRMISFSIDDEKNIIHDVQNHQQSELIQDINHDDAIVPNTNEDNAVQKIMSSFGAVLI